MTTDEPRADTWIVARVQERLAEHGTWQEVRVSDQERQMGQWLFRIARGGKMHVFAVPTRPATEGEIDVLVDLAVATLEQADSDHGYSTA